MIFGEVITQDPAVPLPLFRHHGRQDWTAAGDEMVANLGRTMKLAGDPHYMVWWRIKGLDRVDEWEAHFKTPEGRLYQAETPVTHAVRFQRNGLYDEVIGEGTVGSGLHLVEFFEADAHDATDLVRIFERRQRDAGGGVLKHVLKRIGLIAPDPGGIALWTFASYADAEPFLRRPIAASGLAIAAAGLYRNFGEEII